MYYGARFYVPGLGRFASADSIIPNPANPQSYNRYAYVLNRPVKYQDPTGHRPTDGCEYEGCELDDYLDPNETWITAQGQVSLIDPVLAAQYPGDFTWEEALFTATGLVGFSALPAAVEYGVAQVALPALTKAVGTVASWLCLRDGDCTNEAQSIWRLNPFQRGVAIENSLGRSPQLVQNFPVIYRFQNGVATSIKSLDLGAKGYQNTATLTRTVQGYVNTLANWQGVRWGGVDIQATSITAREVILAIPPGASQAQMNALVQLQQWSASTGVTLNIVVVP
ncbi:MAG: hypothetical protein BroJett015_47710 [Chloroflexota bacterium]|nr:MAG: hypothetical protein BroJett015_47710 [Chloroflexota bacterium]